MRRFPALDVKATGHQIKQIRISQGYSVADIQAYIGLEPTATAIYKWERGENLPSIDHLFALAKLFKVPIEEILVIREEPN